MNDKIQDNLISAYHDGELSAAERAGVERLLASSPEAHAELESYRKLSSLLREAGRPTLQSDLMPVVMQTIEQRMLLPTTASQPLNYTRKSKTWTKWAGFVAVAAAGIVLAVNLIPPAKQDQIANNNPKPPVTPQIVVPQPAPLTPQTVGGNTVANANPATPEKTNVAPQLVASDLPMDIIENLKKANPGKIVRFLRNSGKDVTVFHLMVLDVQPGLESLQMILSAQQISGPKNQPKQSGVVAVYVQANQDQLDKVIAELMSQDQQQFVALAVPQKPVKASDIQKLMTEQPENVASSQVPMKRNELTKLGVNDVQREQILAARGPRNSHGATSPLAVKLGRGDNSSERKVLIVVEKVPELLLPSAAAPQN